MKYTQKAILDSEGEFIGVSQTWTGTVEEIEEEFPVKIIYPEGYLEVWGTPLENKSAY
jgi:hypothetical protein